ncbi:MAG: acyltransferase [Pseudomonadota bacterium]|nr:acyltransferase [Pseudomonadota bacterium]
MADGNPTSQPPRLHMLDGLRGICAISLMFYHMLSWNGAALFQIGTFGVYFFYVLSGFSLWYVYAGRPLAPDMLKTFFIARVARIW